MYSLSVYREGFESSPISVWNWVYSIKTCTIQNHWWHYSNAKERPARHANAQRATNLNLFIHLLAYHKQS